MRTSPAVAPPGSAIIRMAGDLSCINSVAGTTTSRKQSRHAGTLAHEVRLRMHQVFGPPLYRRLHAQRPITALHNSALLPKIIAPPKEMIIPIKRSRLRRQRRQMPNFPRGRRTGSMVKADASRRGEEEGEAVQRMDERRSKKRAIPLKSREGGRRREIWQRYEKKT